MSSFYLLIYSLVIPINQAVFSFIHDVTLSFGVTAPFAGAPDVDYVSRADDPTSTVRFAPNNAEVTCPVTIKEDSMREGTEKVDIKLGAMASPNAAVTLVLGTNTITTLTIIDDEGNHQLLRSPLSSSLQEKPKTFNKNVCPYEIRGVFNETLRALYFQEEQ